MLDTQSILMLTINKINMKGKKKNIGSPICGIDYVFRRIGSKYKARILLYLYRNKVLRYGELRRNVIDITPKMLTRSLRELEQDERPLCIVTCYDPFL